MDELPDESVQMCVTSPPYWGLRKYSGNQDLLWGNHNGCEHEWISKTRRLHGGTVTTAQVGSVLSGAAPTDWVEQDNICSLCGAWRGSFGLEPTPGMYVSHSIEILREIRRVLRKDGVVFWNVGDSYAGSGGPGSQYDNKATFEKFHNPNRKITSCKPKDLCLIPFRVAIAAQEDGWWVRSVIIWDRPNAMPESVKDRPTESHEYILMLTKSANYYWNQEAVREPLAEATITDPRMGMDRFEHNGKTAIREAETNGKEMCNSFWFADNKGRNVRSVWSFPTHPYPEAHFATFPEELPKRCIKAGSKEGDIVLDPFAGSGTSLWVAKRLGRKAVGYELSSEYCELIIKRNRQQVML